MSEIKGNDDFGSEWKCFLQNWVDLRVCSCEFVISIFAPAGTGLYLCHLNLVENFAVEENPLRIEKDEIKFISDVKDTHQLLRLLYHTSWNKTKHVWYSVDVFCHRIISFHWSLARTRIWLKYTHRGINEGLINKSSRKRTISLPKLNIFVGIKQTYYLYT